MISNGRLQSGDQMIGAEVKADFNVSNAFWHASSKTNGVSSEKLTQRSSNLVKILDKTPIKTSMA